MNVNPADASTLLFCPENLSPREAAVARELARGGSLRLVVPGLAPLGAEPPPGVRAVSWRAWRKGRERIRPAFVVYASAPSAAWHWKVWWWKRRQAPGALLGGGWNPTPTARTGRMQRWLASRALDSLDFWFAETRAEADALQAVGVPPGRTLLLGGEGAEREGVATFLERRRQAEARSVLWVDDELSLNSPSTKHLVYSLPQLRAEGWEVRGWCLSADDDARAGMEVRRFPAAPARLRVFTPYWFFGVVNLHGIVQTILKGRPPARIVHTVGGAFLGADLVSIQFVNHVWLRKQFALGLRGFKDVATLGLTLLGVGKDQLQFSNPRCRLFLAASDSIGEEIRRRCLPTTEVRTLANSYDESRFNPAVRRQWREPVRSELDLAKDDTVFCFASQGHYKRKGFWLAVEALARLRQRTDLPKASGTKFLVIGGQPDTLARLQAELAGQYPDWQSWIVFTGSQRAVERYFAAADAFLFPSYFEAFCLAEIEAGAMGLPLLLTPHHGTEMILRPGSNGLRLEFDPGQIEAALASFLTRGLPPFTPDAGRALDRTSYARELAGIYRDFLNPPSVA